MLGRLDGTLERGTGTVRVAGVGVVICGRRRRAAALPPCGGGVEEEFLAVEDIFVRERLSESESELMTKGSKELDAGLLLRDCVNEEAVPSTCERIGGEGWRMLLRRACACEELLQRRSDVTVMPITKWS